MPFSLFNFNLLDLINFSSILECPSNLATLCYKAVEQLVHSADSSCATQQEHCTGVCILYTKFCVINLSKFVSLQLSTVYEFLHDFFLTFLRILTGAVSFGPVCRLAILNKDLKMTQIAQKPKQKNLCLWHNHFSMLYVIFSFAQTLLYIPVKNLDL